MKKTISILLSLILILSVFTVIPVVSAGAAGNSVTWNRETDYHLQNGLHLTPGQSYEDREGITMTAVEGEVSGWSILPNDISNIDKAPSVRFSYDTPFTKIVIRCYRSACISPPESGWKDYVTEAVWTGNANEVDFYGGILKIDSITFYFGGSDDSDDPLETPTEPQIDFEDPEIAPLEDPDDDPHLDPQWWDLSDEDDSDDDLPGNPSNSGLMVSRAHNTSSTEPPTEPLTEAPAEKPTETSTEAPTEKPTKIVNTGKSTDDSKTPGATADSSASGSGRSTTSPKTGQETAVLFVMLGVMFAAACAIIFTRRKNS